MSDVVVHHIGGGGGSAYAFVIVNYPAGSTVTCTNSSGNKDLSTTQKLFYIKKGVTSCVVTATLSGKSATKTITGITEGSSQTITLAYELVIYNRGATSYTWTPSGSASLESDHLHTHIEVSFGAYPTSYIKLNELIDFTKYKTLTFIAKRDESRYSSSQLQIFSAGSNNAVYSKAIEVSASEQQYTLDISGNTITSGWIKLETGGASESGIGGSTYTTNSDVYYIVLQ